MRMAFSGVVRARSRTSEMGQKQTDSLTHSPTHISLYSNNKENLNFDPFLRDKKAQSTRESIHISATCVFGAAVGSELCAIFYCIKIEISCYHNRTHSL